LYFGVDRNDILIEDVDSKEYNLRFFSPEPTRPKGGAAGLSVKREYVEDNNWVGEGDVRIVIQFKTTVMIGDNSLDGYALDGYALDGKRLKEVVNGGNLFVLNFNANPNPRVVEEGN
jgi:hypothetical protein